MLNVIMLSVMAPKLGGPTTFGPKPFGQQTLGRPTLFKNYTSWQNDVIIAVPTNNLNNYFGQRSVGKMPVG
jgi:hypothetical protein